MHDSYIAQDHILLALIQDPSIAPILKENSLTEATLKTAIEQIRGNRRVESKSAESGFDALSKYAVDLTALAEEGKIDPVIGRDNEIRRAIRILCRRLVLTHMFRQVSGTYSNLIGQKTILFLLANQVLARPPSQKVSLSELSSATCQPVSSRVSTLSTWAR